MMISQVVRGYRMNPVVVNTIRFVRKSLLEHVHCINQHQIETAFVVRHNANIDNERHPAVWQQLGFVFRPLTVGTPLRASFYIRTFYFFTFYLFLSNHRRQWGPRIAPKYLVYAGFETAKGNNLSFVWFIANVTMLLFSIINTPTCN